MLESLAIKFLSWRMKKKNMNSIEIVVRSDGDTLYIRDKKREKEAERIKNIVEDVIKGRG
ncbi:MAG: hypothetical protein ACRCX8_08755 [Sarcina sp.]